MTPTTRLYPLMSCPDAEGTATGGGGVNEGEVACRKRFGGGGMEVIFSVLGLQLCCMWWWEEEEGQDLSG